MTERLALWLIRPPGPDGLVKSTRQPSGGGSAEYDGSDTIRGAAIASGGTVSDTIIGPVIARERLVVLMGGIGDDTIEVPQEAGRAVVVGGGSSDDVIGGNSNDVIIVGTDSGHDASFVRGRGGNDVVIEQGANSSLLKGGSGNDVLIAGSGDGLVGGIGNDTLLGGTFNETLLGKDGDDTLIGGPGDDVLDGGSGNDLEVQ